MKNGDLVLERILTGEVFTNHSLEWDFSDVFPPFLSFFLSESETRQQSAAVLHATSCGWRLPCQEAQNRQCESSCVTLCCCCSLPTVSVITEKHAHIRPQLASLIRQPSLLMDFLLFFPSDTSVTAPAPPLAPQKGWQINSSATFLDQWTMRQWQRCGLTHWTQRHIVRYPALPALPCHVNWEYMMCLTGAIMWPVVSCSISALLVMCVGGFFV